MLLDLIAFGGVVFWALFVIAFVVEVAAQETGGSVIAFIISIAVFYGLSQPPIIEWGWIGAYFLIGIVWWLSIFQYRLAAVKRWTLKNPEKCVNRAGERYLRSMDITDSKIRLYYDKEPSYATFMDRTFCWPASMFRIALEDIAQDLYNKLAHWLKTYKARYLNLDI